MLMRLGVKNDDFLLYKYTLSSIQQLVNPLCVVRASCLAYMGDFKYR